MKVGFSVVVAEGRNPGPVPGILPTFNWNKGRIDPGRERFLRKRQPVHPKSSIINGPYSRSANEGTR